MAVVSRELALYGGEFNKGRKFESNNLELEYFRYNACTSAVNMATAGFFTMAADCSKF
jgi:hypothetical protein